MSESTSRRIACANGRAGRHCLYPDDWHKMWLLDETWDDEPDRECTIEATSPAAG